jgi:hypothetical protein
VIICTNPILTNPARFFAASATIVAGQPRGGGGNASPRFLDPRLAREHLRLEGLLPQCHSAECTGTAYGMLGHLWHFTLADRLRRASEAERHRLGWILVGYIELTDQYSTLRAPPETLSFLAYQY